jgi:hypothetical protein
MYVCQHALTYADVCWQAHTELKHAGQTFPLSIEFGVDKMEADIWSHIRKVLVKLVVVKLVVKLVS